jgi:hypothetical protein
MQIFTDSSFCECSANASEIEHTFTGMSSACCQPTCTAIHAIRQQICQGLKVSCLPVHWYFYLVAEAEHESSVKHAFKIKVLESWSDEYSLQWKPARPHIILPNLLIIPPNPYYLYTVLLFAYYNYSTSHFSEFIWSMSCPPSLFPTICQHHLNK